MTTDVKGFTMLFDTVTTYPYGDKQIGITGALVFGVVYRICQYKNSRGYPVGICRKPMQDLADLAGLSVKSVQRYLAILAECGFLADLDIGLRNRPHRYKDTGKIRIVTKIEAETNENTRNGSTQTPSPSNHETRNDSTRTRSPSTRTLSPSHSDSESIVLNHVETLLNKDSFYRKDFIFSEKPFPLSEIKQGFVYQGMDTDQLQKMPYLGQTAKGVYVTISDTEKKWLNVSRQEIYYLNGGNQMKRIVIPDDADSDTKMPPDVKQIFERMIELVGPSKILTEGQRLASFKKIKEKAVSFVKHKYTLDQLNHYDNWFTTCNKAEFGGQRDIDYLANHWRTAMEWQPSSSNGPKKVSDVVNITNTLHPNQEHELYFE